jgi:hypothetical protein
MDTIKEFHLKRVEDETGISGTGVVARGVILPSGTCILEWCTFHSSINHYKNIGDVEEIHGHHGKTLVVMGPPPIVVAEKPKKSRKKKDASSSDK